MGPSCALQKAALSTRAICFPTKVICVFSQDPAGFFMAVFLTAGPLLFVSAFAQWHMFKVEQEKEGLEYPCIANKWSADTPLGTTPGYVSVTGKDKEEKKKKKKKRKDKDDASGEKRSKKRDKTKDGEEKPKRRRSKKQPLPQNEAEYKPVDQVVD